MNTKKLKMINNNTEDKIKINLLNLSKETKKLNADLHKNLEIQNNIIEKMEE